MRSYYEELLADSKQRIDEFFHNIKLFENQFTYDEFNEKCEVLMYQKNNPESIATVKELKANIPELAAMCKACAGYYMRVRNKSVKTLDVQMGIFFEDLLVEYLSRRHGLDVVRGNINNTKYPDCVIRDTETKKVSCYFEVKYHAAPFLTANNMLLPKGSRLCYECSATLDKEKVAKQIDIIEQEIDVPVFYVHWIDYPCLKGIYFETVPQVKDDLIMSSEYNRREREGDFKEMSDGTKKKKGYLAKVYPRQLTMGDFNELIKIFTQLSQTGGIRK